jgi:hypothetical protein
MASNCITSPTPVCSQTTQKGLCSCGGIVTVALQNGSNLFYTGPNLPGSGIRTCDNFNDSMAKIDAKLLSLAEDMAIIKGQLKL